MNTLLSFIQIFVGAVALLLTLLSIVFFIHPRWPAVAIWGLKVSVSALSTVFIFTGLLIFIAGFLTDTSFIVFIGAFIILIYLQHYIAVTRPPASKSGFEQAFGRNWKDQILPKQRKYFLPSRMVLKLPPVPEPRLEQNISFATIPNSDHKLLCDIWQPSDKIKPSGLAFIYMHGGAFYILDKDFGSRPFFRNLAAQGHVIMDVAYRLASETDLMGMIHDVKRAIAWMKENALSYSVDPELIIIGGGSSGGYLALMAAYTSNDSRFTPEELNGKDISCCAVIAEFPPTDLEALYYHTNQHISTRSENGRSKKNLPTNPPAWLKKIIGKDLHRINMDKKIENIGNIEPLMGGHPDQCPEHYIFFSPFTYVNSSCPPTLLIQGNHDIMSPVKSTRLLYEKLIREKVPAILHILPQTDHAFNRFLPNIAPSAHNAIYNAECFLAIAVNKKNIQKE